MTIRPFVFMYMKAKVVPQITFWHGGHEYRQRESIWRGREMQGRKNSKKKKQEKQCSDLFEYKYYAGCLKEHFLLIHLAVAYIFIFALRGQT